jgi:hypothetical protein
MDEDVVGGLIDLNLSALAKVLLDVFRVRWRYLDYPSFGRITLHQSINFA